jgi:hypothetical protein
VFDGLFLVSLLLMGVVAIRHYRSLSREQQVILVAYGLYAGLLVADMAVAHGVVPWERIPVSWGALAFSVAVVSVSIRQYSRAHKDLAALNLSLERQVAERTARAEALALREQDRARQLLLESHKARKLADVISDLQDCKGVTQGLDALVRSLPALCQPMRGAFYRRVAPDRFERVSRWGGADADFPDILGGDTPVPLPTESEWAVPGRATGDGPSRPVVHCFWLNVESASAGSVTEGILLVQPEPGLETPQAVGLSQTLASLQQFLDKIGITLSGILLREQFRESDTVCRYGGEEFVVMMPRASLGEALDKAEALRGSIARVPVMDKGVDLGRITISVGVATWPESTEVFASLLRESDAALYRAKSEGRNRVVAAAVPEL